MPTIVCHAVGSRLTTKGGSQTTRVASIATVTEGYSLRQMEVLPKLAQMSLLEE